MNLHTLKPNRGAKHRVKRLGCGESSGQGKTSGRGHKGQKSRSGGGVRPGFEGGQMPLHRRLPKRGFNNTRFQDKIAVVNVAFLNDRFEDGDTVNMETLKAARLVKGTYVTVKVLGNGDISKKLTVEGCKVSATAKEKIEKAGGSIVEVEEPSK
ncbi:MAG: 50S ribosomal protein L15 [Akkermansiaceae bacterium]|jgi:large subunit ribosomal protein L15|tara:strand:+ start:12410 stop:12871 length:462 start_codon:yes stop_codon:yes gene_type:complete